MDYDQAERISRYYGEMVDDLGISGNRAIGAVRVLAGRLAAEFQGAQDGGIAEMDANDTGSGLAGISEVIQEADRVLAMGRPLYGRQWALSQTAIDEIKAGRLTVPASIVNWTPGEFLGSRLNRGAVFWQDLATKPDYKRLTREASELAILEHGPGYWVISDPHRSNADIQDDLTGTVRTRVFFLDWMPTAQTGRIIVPSDWIDPETLTGGAADPTAWAPEHCQRLAEEVRDDLIDLKGHGEWHLYATHDEGGPCSISGENITTRAAELRWVTFEKIRELAA